LKNGKTQKLEEEVKKEKQDGEPWEQEVYRIRKTEKPTRCESSLLPNLNFKLSRINRC
jgi:hypothetical protein